MKTSNKVLMGFFGGVFIYMSALFIEIRLRGESDDFNHGSSELESIPLNDLKYVILADLDEFVTVRSSDEPRMELRSREGNILPSLSYEFQQDTLNLKSLDLQEDTRLELIIFVPKDAFAGIESKDANIRITDIEQSSLSVTISGGRVTIDRDVFVNNLNIVASQKASLNAFDLELDTVVLQMDKSSMYMQSSIINRLQGSMSNDSNLTLGSVNDINFKKDESCQLRMFD